MRPAQTGLGAEQVLTTWLVTRGKEPAIAAVLDWLRTHQPHLTLVGFGHSVTDE